jgi:hypothetical protein
MPFYTKPEKSELRRLQREQQRAKYPAPEPIPSKSERRKALKVAEVKAPFQLKADRKAILKRGLEEVALF